MYLVLRIMKRLIILVVPPFCREWVIWPQADRFLMEIRIDQSLKEISFNLSEIDCEQKWYYTRSLLLIPLFLFISGSSEFARTL